MSTNRLQLDFNIQSIDERKAFVDKYISLPQFQRVSLSAEELETIANYILWGKDSDGLTCQKRGEVQIETRNKTWQRDDIESLDALMESPNFTEASLRRPTEARTRIPREVFDRQKALRESPAHIRAAFEELFTRIDKLEMAIHFYEYKHGRRKEPPREELTRRFSEQDVQAAEALATKWNQYTYLKQRHHIVELRREQFTLRDQYTEKHLRHTLPEPEEPFAHLDLGTEVPVFPIGLIGEPISKLAFKSLDKLNPTTYSQDDLRKLTRLYWQKKDMARPALFFDFQELEHVYALLNQISEMEEEIDSLPFESNLRELIETLRFYIRMAELSESQQEILDLKISKMKNQDIADIVNKKYNKSYTANYISTLFRQKIIPKINAAAAFHALLVENLCFEENFKRCSDCGKILLIDAKNFVRKTRSKDGFSARCKKCDKLDRQKRR